MLRGAGGERDSDIRSRSDLLHRGARDATLERVRRLERAFRNDVGMSRDANGAEAHVEPGVLLAFAYPDRIAKRRAGDGGRYQLANGRGARFANPESIAREEFIVAVDVDDRERDARILLAAPLAREDLIEHFAAQLVEREEVVWDARSGGRGRAQHDSARGARDRREAARRHSARRRGRRSARRLARARDRSAALG